MNKDLNPKMKLEYDQISIKGCPKKCNNKGFTFDFSYILNRYGSLK